MTKTEVLNFIMAVKPHEFEDGVMRRWLVELEDRIRCEIRGEEPSSSDGEALCVPPPYDRVYWTYLSSMLDLAQGSATAYAMSDRVFREAYADYAKFVQRSGSRRIKS